MTYNVLTTPEAEERIAEAFEVIQKDSPQNAEKWLRGILRAIASLDTFPDRCGFAREQDFLPGRKLRQLIYHSHRVIYEVDEATQTVRVLYVQHTAQRAIGEPNLDDD